MTSSVRGAYNTALYYGTPPENYLFQAVLHLRHPGRDRHGRLRLPLSMYLKNHQAVAVKMYMVGGTDEYA